MNLEELEKRMTRLEDIEEIKSLHREYVFMLVNRQWNDMPECFAEDATADIGRHGLRRGKPEIKKLFNETISRMNAGKGRDAHFATMPVITVNGNRATGHWMLYIMVRDKDTGYPRYSQGRYDCEYVKENGKWLFSAVKYTGFWPAEPDNVP